MIRFSLRCASDHGFDGWFRSSQDFENQSARKLVACPVCGSAQVEKALMAPAVATARAGETVTLAGGAEQKKAMAELKALAQRMRADADYVGDKFAEEARKIHFREVDPRGIYGEATREEARALAEDGIGFMPIPVFPDDQN